MATLNYDKLTEQAKNPSEEIKAKLKVIYDLCYPNGKDICNTPLYCEQMKKALKLRTGLSWRVRNSRGTAWGWVRIAAPSNRAADGDDELTEDDQLLLGLVLGQTRVHFQGESLPSGSCYKQHAMEMVCLMESNLVPETYWD
jgi:hypothetical protein